MERFVSGGLAGAIGQIFVFPLDVARTRLAITDKIKYNGIIDCIRKIIKYEGLAKLYGGFSPTLIGIFPYAGIDLSVFFWLRDNVNYYNKKYKYRFNCIMAFFGFFFKIII